MWPVFYALALSAFLRPDPCIRFKQEAEIRDQLLQLEGKEGQEDSEQQSRCKLS